MRTLLSLIFMTLVSPLAAQSVGLVPGQSAAFDLPAGGYTTGLHFDVPAGATAFKVELDSGTPGVDLDLFMRFGNTFSSQNTYGLPMDFDTLQDQAHYFAVSGGAAESIAIGRSNYRPIRAGRWFLSVLNFATVSANSRVKVEFTNTAPSPLQFDVRFNLAASTCNIAPWNDVTPAVPVGGNPGTTLGAQRRNAMIEALRQLAAGLDSETPITVRACWDSFAVSPSGGATLAAAGPDDFVLADRSLVFTNGGSFRPAAYLPEKYTFYASAPAARLAGTRACSLRGGDCADATDMVIFYNQNIGTAGVLNGRPFYLGYNAAPVGTLDFLAVSVHELAHGLGFLSTLRRTGTVGAKSLGRDDIFTRQIIDNQSFPFRPFPVLTDAERASAMTSLNGVSWIDERAVNSPQNTPTGFPGILMFAPNPIQSGSSLSHLDTFYSGQLMTPTLSLAGGSRQLGLALPMLYAVGWDPSPTTFPTSPAPFAGLWYERDRNGHGVDFQRIFTDAAGFDVYSLIFYTYDSSGRPEWYIAVGQLIDGAFVPAKNAAGFSLVRYRYVGGTTPQQAIAAESGQVVFDFNQPNNAPACNDGTNRPGVGTLGVFRYTIAGVSDSWCMEELIPALGRADNDLTGTWFAGNGDAGWGSSVSTGANGAQTLLFSTLYYPDSTGAGRWAFVSSANYQPGQSLTVTERRGYCRTCPESITDTPIGTMTANLRQAVQSQAGANRLSFDVTYGGPEGGRFSRPELPYEVLSVPQ